MKTQPQNHIAVLTGDIVGSTNLSRDQLETALLALKHCAEMQEEWVGVTPRFTRHRGDGWQVVLAKPQYALRSALAFRAALRAQSFDFDSYIAIAAGQGPETIATNLNDETSSVFVESGQGLDDLLESRAPIRMIHQSLGAYDAATILADHISQGWTQAQAAAMLPKLAPEANVTTTEIARLLGKSRQAVAKSLSAAGYDSIDLALETLDRDFE
jgi:hypothetical protein